MVAPPSSSSSSAAPAVGPSSSVSRPPNSSTSSSLHPQPNYPYHHNHPPKHPFSPPHNPSTISAPQSNRQQHARSYSSTSSSAEPPMMMKQRHPQQQGSTHGPSHTQKTETQHHRHPQAQHNSTQFPRNDHEHQHAQTRVQAPVHGPAQTHARAASSQQSSRLEPGHESRRSHSRSHSQTFGPDGHHNHYGAGPTDSGDYHPLQQPQQPQHHPHHHGGQHHSQPTSSRPQPQYQENAPGAPRSSRPGPAPASHSTFSTPPSLPSGQTHGGPIRTHTAHHPHPYQMPQAHSLHSRGPPHPSHHQQAPSHQHPNGPPPVYDHPSYGHPNHRYPPMENGYGRSAPQYPQQMSSRDRPGQGYNGHAEAPRTNNASRAIAVDDDEEDEDDGEIKQDSRIQRSGSTAGLVQDGASKKHTQGDHDPADVHKCMDCGKVYKHPNCLWKHRWEHSNYWKSATKFLLSKHQQVRMMEAAAILLGLDSTRESDQDAIVGMVSKQRGAAAQSIGSSSSSSSSPPTSTKSLSTSPPPQNDRLMAGRAGYGSMTMTEAQNNDIQMLTALRNSASKQGGSAVQMPSLTSTVPAANSTATATTTKSSTSSSSSSSSSPTASKSTSSSNSSTPPTLAPDDDTLPEADEDMAVVSPPNQRGSMASTPTIATVRTMEKGAVTVELGLGMDMDLDMEMTRKQQSQQQGRPSQPPTSMEDPHHYQYRGYQPQRESDPYASPQFRKQQ